MREVSTPYQQSTAFSFTEWMAKKSVDFTINTLRTGEVPKHIGLIMDGNRRLAKMAGIEVKAGHESGYLPFHKLTDFAWRICVKTVSAYAFSIETYRRPQPEVDDLMELLKEKLHILQVCAEKHEACVRILGEKHLIREGVLADMEAVEAKTKKNTKAALNICFAYTGRAEIATAIRTTVREAAGDEKPALGSTEGLQSSQEITMDHSRSIYILRMTLHWTCSSEQAAQSD